MSDHPLSDPEADRQKATLSVTRRGRLNVRFRALAVLRWMTVMGVERTQVASAGRLLPSRRTFGAT